MNSISVNYTLKYELDAKHNYVWTGSGKCFKIFDWNGNELEEQTRKHQFYYCI